MRRHPVAPGSSRTDTPWRSGLWYRDVGFGFRSIGPLNLNFLNSTAPTYCATGNSCDTSCYQGCGTPQGGDAYEGCAIYHGSDSALYLRFKPSSLYHIAFSVDSMYVGNGYVLKRNDIEVVVDPSASL